eukprot:3524113-Rhodomonas_salina.1
MRLIRCVPNGTRSYEVTFIAFTVGPYALAVTLNQQRVEDKVFRFEVLPGTDPLLYAPTR